ncbi:MAG: hypothetical protein HOJ77_04965 [Flavobacteriales bacterium]|jgi:hypothetical protein|nr:hypothetical protein [Flavobacteriales bacterium]
MKYLSFLLLFLLSSCTWNEIIPVSESDICNPEEQYYLDVVQPIIENNCAGCHNVNSDRLAILNSFDGVIDALNNYSLKDRVTSLQMPQYGSPPLSESEINIIQKWADCE